MTDSETERHQSETYVIAIAVSTIGIVVGIIFIAFVLNYRNKLPICRNNISISSCLVCGGESPTGVELDLNSSEEDRTMLGDEMTYRDGDRMLGSQAD
jgi:hypothetical protein